MASVEGFVDCHSHVVPSGDDGATSVAEAVELCRNAALHGTRVLFATPHVWPHLPLTREREERVHACLARVAPHAGLELRLGYELTPWEGLLAEDPQRYVLAGTTSVLMEVPFAGPIDPLVELAEHVEGAGFTPVIAHPERTEAVEDEPALAAELARRGWPLQVNATSLLGRHDEVAAELAWRFLEEGDAALVASDGHRTARPPQLDAAFALACERLGDERARPLFDGSALGVQTPRATAGLSRAESAPALFPDR